MKKFLMTILTIILLVGIVAGLFLGGVWFAVKYKGAKIPNESDEVLNPTVCLYECEAGKAYIDSEIDRLIGYRDEGIENYFPDMTHEEVAEYVEANLHTLIVELKEDGYDEDALRKAQAIYLYYYLAIIGWDYTTLYSEEIKVVKRVVDADGNFLFDPPYWREVCYKSGV